MTRCRTQVSGRGAFAAVLVSFGLVACAGDVPPPTAQMGASSQAILSAERAGAAQYAPAELQSARAKMVAADAAMRADNRIEARRLAEEAQADANVAAAKAQNAAAQQAATVVRRDLQALRQGTPEPFGAAPPGAGYSGSTYPTPGQPYPVYPNPGPPYTGYPGAVAVAPPVAPPSPLPPGATPAPLYPYGSAGSSTSVTTTVPGTVPGAPPAYGGPTSWSPQGMQQSGTTTTTTTIVGPGQPWVPDTTTSVEAGKSVSVGVPR